MDRQRTHTIGVVGYGTEITDHPNFFDEIVRGILHGAAMFDLDITIVRPSQWSGPESLPVFGAKRYDGVIILATALLDRIFEGVDLSGLPAVTIGGAFERPDFPSVDVDNYGSSRAAVQHLIDQGHRRIAYVSASGLAGWARERYRAYVDAITEAGVPVEDDLVVHLDIPGVDDGYEAACQIFAVAPDKRPTAVATVNDDVALGVFSRIKELGLRIPADVSVIGFDDSPGAVTEPPLSTIRQPKHAIGTKAVELMIARLDNPGAPVPHVTIPGELVLRSSTARTMKI